MRLRSRALGTANETQSAAGWTRDLRTDTGRQRYTHRSEERRITRELVRHEGMGAWEIDWYRTIPEQTLSRVVDRKRPAYCSRPLVRQENAEGARARD